MRQDAAEVSELAFRAFIRAFGLFRSRMEVYFARFGISGAQWGILRALHRAEGEGLEGVRVTELGHRLLVKTPSVTTLLDRLERMGLIARERLDADQRAKHVKLTGRGRQLLTRVLKRHPQQIQTMLAGLSAAEQQDLHRLMQKFAMHLETLDDVRSQAHKSRPRYLRSVQS